MDERGVSRRYEASFRDDEWQWWRNSPDFSPRCVVTIAADGRTMASRRRVSRDGGRREPDLQMTYTRAG